MAKPNQTQPYISKADLFLNEVRGRDAEAAAALVRCRGEIAELEASLAMARQQLLDLERLKLMTEAVMAEHVPPHQIEGSKS